MGRAHRDHTVLAGPLSRQFAAHVPPQNRADHFDYVDFVFWNAV